MGSRLRQNWLGQLGGALVAVWIVWAEGSAAWPKDIKDIMSAAPEAISSPALPIPWEWVYDLQEQARQRQCTLVGLLRSRPLPAPDPQWQVYTRLDLVATPQTSRLTSVLFAKNTRTQALQVIYQAAASVYDPVEPLDFAMILPLAWQDNTLLAREYAGWFQTDLSWDRAVIWPLPADSNRIPPVQVWEPPPALGYAELLDWDPQARGRVLFAVADSLEEVPRLVSVGPGQDLLLRGTAPLPTSEPPLPQKGWTSATLAGSVPICHANNFGLNIR
ncbi:hypothetical protein ACVW0Q_001211 [Thermostichus sp. MS-CIW-21]|jgi:hypothetical protein|uniref:hypothetical protein n=1 Tax=unclassified Synechococcus TaxID=2626047 RepID=UPI00059B73AC|nr:MULTISPECIES: hypothetical protein [unclassified Synechococcus]PIK91091.1 hypothetical protein SYN65AY6LI_01775 [Synechococcus sp. 65AY6Li]